MDDFNGNVYTLRNNGHPYGVSWGMGGHIFSIITVTPTGLWRDIGHLLVIGSRTAMRLYKGHVQKTKTLVLPKNHQSLLCLLIKFSAGRPYLDEPCCLYI